MANVSFCSLLCSSVYRIGQIWLKMVDQPLIGVLLLYLLGRLYRDTPGYVNPPCILKQSHLSQTTRTRQHDAAQKNQERADQPEPARKLRQAGDDAPPPEQQQRESAKHQNIRSNIQRTRFLSDVYARVDPH